MNYLGRKICNWWNTVRHTMKPQVPIVGEPAIKEPKYIEQRNRTVLEVMRDFDFYEALRTIQALNIKYNHDVVTIDVLKDLFEDGLTKAMDECFKQYVNGVLKPEYTVTFTCIQCSCRIEETTVYASAKLVPTICTYSRDIRLFI